MAIQDALAAGKIRLKRAVTKNSAEIEAFITGKMPSFITRNRPVMPVSRIPVFTFHDVEPETFETQARYLVDNGYRTLDADEVTTLTRSGEAGDKAVALTFDDATWTFWTYAYPILRKYGLKAILFVIAGVVPEDTTNYPNLADLWQGGCQREDLERRRGLQPLCTWRELLMMHESKIVDIQSHSLTHSRVSVSDKLVDFLHPHFDSYVANLNLPVYSVDTASRPERKLHLGAPVFETAPRLASRLRFKENPQVLELTTRYVAERGGPAFFKRPNWRKELSAVVRRWPRDRRGTYETAEEREVAVRREFAESRAILERRLPSKSARHFCYPWFQGSPLADRVAAETGYRSIHCGLLLGRSVQNDLLRVQRVGEEYLLRLPGKERVSLWSVWSRKIARPQMARPTGSAS